MLIAGLAATTAAPAWGQDPAGAVDAAVAGYLATIQPFQGLIGGLCAIFAAGITAWPITRAARRNAEANTKAVQAQIEHARRQAHEDRVAAQRQREIERQHRRAQLARALAGEIGSIATVERERAISGGGEFGRPFMNETMRDYCTIYMHQASTLGDLEGDIPLRVASWYTKFFGALEIINSDLRARDKTNCFPPRDRPAREWLDILVDEAVNVVKELNGERARALDRIAELEAEGRGEHGGGPHSHSP